MNKLKSPPFPEVLLFSLNPIDGYQEGIQHYT